MTFGKGGTNPKTLAMAGAKAKVLALVAEGHSVHKAMEICGKKQTPSESGCSGTKNLQPT